MGFYVDVDVLHGKSRKKIGHIQNEKGGLGRAIYMFLPQDFKFDRETLTFTCETTVKAAIDNLTAISEIIAAGVEKAGAKYDEWTNRAVNMTAVALTGYVKMLPSYRGDDVIFADMSEGMLSYNEEQLDKFRPDVDYRNSLRFINDVVSGNYIGYFCGDNIRRLADKLMADVKEIVCTEFINIRKFQRDFNTYNLLTMGDVKILEMKADLIFKKNEDDDDDFYDSANYLLPVFAFLQKRNISLLRTWDKVYSYNEEEERGYRVNIHFDVSNAK